MSDRVRLRITDMDCAGDAAGIEGAAGSAAGVERVKISAAAHVSSVHHAEASLPEVARSVSQLGYRLYRLDEPLIVRAPAGCFHETTQSETRQSS